MLQRRVYAPTKLFLLPSINQSGSRYRELRNLKHPLSMRRHREHINVQRLYDRLLTLSHSPRSLVSPSLTDHLYAESGQLIASKSGIFHRRYNSHCRQSNISLGTGSRPTRTRSKTRRDRSSVLCQGSCVGGRHGLSDIKLRALSINEGSDIRHGWYKRWSLKSGQP